MKNIKALLFFIVSAFVFTWPLGFFLDAQIPLGSESVPTVPFFNLWTLGWNVNRFYHGYQGYYDAPIFYPAKGAFAFSDPQFATGLFAVPFWKINPVLSYNFVLLVFIVLNGFSVYEVLRSQEFSQVPSAIGGLFVQALPFLTNERGVLQLIPIFGMVWAVEAVRRMIESPHLKNGLLLILGITITFLTSEYYGLMLMVVVLPFLIGVVLQGRALKKFVFLCGSLLVGCLLVIPILYPQYKILKNMGFSRSNSTIQRNSAQLIDYISPPHGVLNDKFLPVSPSHNQHLFPGFFLVFSGLVGSILGIRQKQYRFWTICLLCTFLLAFLLSFGLNLHIGTLKPYQLIRDFVPGFENWRTPARFALWVQLGLVFLGVYFWQLLYKSRYFLFLIAFALLGLVDIFPLPQRMASPPSDLNITVRSPVVFLPFVNGTSVKDYQQTSTWMLQALTQEMVILNGYSGYFPPLNRKLKIIFKDFPDPESIAELEEIGVKTLIIQDSWMDPAQKERLADFIQRGILINQQNISGYQIVWVPP